MSEEELRELHHFETEQENADLKAEIERLRTLVGEEGQPGWDNCSRAEAIRQANQFHAEALTWMERHGDRRDERDAVQARLDALVADLCRLDNRYTHCSEHDVVVPDCDNCWAWSAAQETLEDVRAVLDEHAKGD